MIKQTDPIFEMHEWFQLSLQLDTNYNAHCISFTLKKKKKKGNFKKILTV